MFFVRLGAYLWFLTGAFNERQYVPLEVWVMRELRPLIGIVGILTDKCYFDDFIGMRSIAQFFKYVQQENAERFNLLV